MKTLVWGCLVALYLFSSYVAVQWFLPDPYMDEIFHIPQTWEYCKGRWTSWDPKITTPPGLYIVGVLFTSVFGKCSDVAALRAVNLVGLVLGVTLAYHGRSSIRPKILVLATMPLLQFYANIYYTDSWASLLVVLGLAYSHKPVMSAVFLLVSLAFRQTNIVWVTFAAFNAYIVPDISKHGVMIGIDRILRFHFWHLVPYITVVGVFGIFVVWNGFSIVLGDKSNHSMSLHTAQWLYYLLFMAFLSAPLALQQPRFWKSYFVSVVRQWWRTILEIAAIVAIIRYGTIVHPFVLADNRHYVFYLWRRLLHPTWTNWSKAPYAMVPIYHGCYRWFIWSICSSTRQTLLAISGFLATVSAVLMPSPLLEPRYYIVPYLVWRMVFYGPSTSKLEIFWYMLVGGVTTGIFCLSKTHFMW